MKEVTTEVRKSYIDRIAPLEVNGQEIPVVNMVQDAKSIPFVVIATSANGTGTKCSRDWMVSTSIDIVIKTTGDWGGDKLTEDIANIIYNKIDGSRPDYDTTANFKLVTQTVEAADPIIEQYNNGRVIKKTIIIENYVSQIN